MAVALDTTVQEASNKPARSHVTWLMMVGFLIQP